MSTPLFDASLLSQDLLSTLPQGLTLRPLQGDDYSRAHLSLLTHLTSAPDVGQSQWSTRFSEMSKINSLYLTYLPIVIVQDESNELVGSATLVIERKFLRNAGLCGHVEDVVVDPKLQGKKLGVLLLKVLTKLSEDQGCYKTILDCDPKNEAFYVKCGYENKGCEMAKYAEKK
ncbi:glucosamine 6-phosphate N-acetyltransferase [Sporobolomyces koalae]|uniref:glucosamine 6-phosphate N-acetyltransferase n=1 Tax=Sporobolomyces koalae TaxID=500713 RepID=UPI003181FE98